MRNARPRNEITEIRYKQKRGEPLTEQEKDLLAEYFAQYGRRKKSVHLKQQREEVWTTLAAQQGVPLSQWIQLMVEKGLRGNDDALRDLREENQRLRDENASLRSTCGHISVENGNLQSRLEAMETSLTEAMAQALRLAEGKK